LEWLTGGELIEPVMHHGPLEHQQQINPENINTK